MPSAANWLSRVDPIQRSLEPKPGRRRVTRFLIDLVVSAVPFDAGLVAELFGELCLRLRTTPVWDGESATLGPVWRQDLTTERSRIVLVLHQRLWQHDPATAGDAVLLRARMRDSAKSVCVMTLDDAPLPDWLAMARRCDFARAGVRGAADFALEAIEACGGSLEAAPDISKPQRSPVWGDGPTPFLSQPRALSALRHQLDAIAAELAPELERRRAKHPESEIEMHVLPHRMIVRFDDIGISFSWVGGSTPTVAEGRLLVIQWAGVVAETRGTSALRSASPVRERVYRPDAVDAEHWQWRVDGENGQPYSTANLVGEWLATSSLGAC